MKFCFECAHITGGGTAVCNFCGRSYNTKLCPKMHPNPRFAEACSRCGSRDLSVPQRKVPFAFVLAAWVIQSFTGLTLGLLSIRIALSIVRGKYSHSAGNKTLILPVALCLFWLLWVALPTFLRRLIRKILDRDGKMHTQSKVCPVSAVSNAASYS